MKGRVRGLQPIFGRFQAVLFGGLLGVFPSNDAMASIPQPIECQVEADPSENFAYAAVQAWVPPGVREVKGVLCLVLHPLDKGGARLAAPAPWVDFATRRGFVFVAVSFAQSDDATRDWCHPEGGTARALFAALQQIQKKSGTRNLASAPILIAGVCAAGQFAYHLTALAPARILGFAAIGGGKHELSRRAAATRIPAWLAIMPDGGSGEGKKLMLLASLGAVQNAPWQAAWERMEVYDHGFCSVDFFSFLRRVTEGKDSQGLFRASPWLLPRYVPVSARGEKLPVFGSVSLATISAGNIDLFEGEKKSFAFEVQAEKGVNGIEILSSTFIVESKIVPLDQGRWRVTIDANFHGVAAGPFNGEIPVRFLRDGERMLGGTKVHLVGTVKGGVTVSPASLRIGALEAGRLTQTTLRVSSRGESPVEITSVRASQPWVTATVASEDGRPEVCVKFCPPMDWKGKGVAGYLLVDLKSPVPERLRVFYFGSVKN